MKSMKKYAGIAWMSLWRVPCILCLAVAAVCEGIARLSVRGGLAAFRGFLRSACSTQR